MIGPEPLAAALTAAAISIAKGKSTDDIALLGVMYKELGYTLLTLAYGKKAFDKYDQVGDACI